MAEVKWIKITTDIFDDEKILMIESLPSADTIIVIWFKLLTFAGKQNNDGVFLMNNRIAYTDEMLATIFRRDVNVVRLALKTFENFGMIEIIDGVVTIPNWNKHQTLDAYEKKKERDRLYKQERRAKQRLLICESSDKSSDSRQSVAKKSSCVAVSDKEEEKEIIDKEKKKVRKKSSASFDSIILEYAKGDEELIELLGEWLKVRKAKRAAMTDRAIKMNLEKLDALAQESRMTVSEYLKEVICRGWAAFYVINNYGFNGGKKQEPEKRVYEDFNVNDW